MSVGRPKGRNPMVNVRLDPVVFEALQTAAKSNKRTIAAEVQFRLLKSMIEENIRAERIAPTENEDAA